MEVMDLLDSFRFSLFAGEKEIGVARIYWIEDGSRLMIERALSADPETPPLAHELIGRGNIVIKALRFDKSTMKVVTAVVFDIDEFCVADFGFLGFDAMAKGALMELVALTEVRFTRRAPREGE